jgi:hypothetical protein
MELQNEREQEAKITLYVCLKRNANSCWAPLNSLLEQSSAATQDTLKLGTGGRRKVVWG